MSNPLRKKRGNAIIWVLMAMLILGLGGFGARNFGGNIRSIGTVGDRDIDLRDYARALNREIAALSNQIGEPVSFVQAQSLGIERGVQERVIAATALDNEVAKLGISVGDAEVRRRIMAVQAFQGLDGSFSRETYTLALRQEGLSEAEFEGKLRDEAARTLLQGAVLGATAAPEAFVDRLAAWVHETRDFTVAELLPSDLLEPVGAPDDAALTAYYDAHPDEFTRPEIRRITYVWLSPDMLLDEVVLDEGALKAAYDERIDEFVTPERRLVERLVYPSIEEAAAAKARLDAGEADFAALAAERGLALEDTDLGEVTAADLGTAGEAVFSLTEPGVIGPLPSDLGPALFSMNAILEAREVSFEDAREDLSAEVAMDQARRLVAERNESIEDILAGGATLEEVAAETGMTLGTIDFDVTTEDGIAAYAGFRAAAQAATADDFPTLAALDDGGVFALRLDGIDPPALQPLDEVRDAATTSWTRAETRTALMALAAEVKDRLTAGQNLAATGLVTTRYDDFARGGFIQDAPAEVAEKVFTMAVGDSA
ncbi:MAG: SurA N-terminal domain-containing protein, partial [Rhodobacteraceae bacterium]|nr:SurA N-terminal domain-containing protein [Paracoccaceae bacterium]